MTIEATSAPGSDLVIDTQQLRRSPGAMLEFKKVVPAPAELGNYMIGVPAGEPLTIGLRLEAVTEGVLVSGVVRATAVGECSRCLDPVTQVITARINELFVYPERVLAVSEAGSDADDGEDLAVLDGDYANIEPAIRDAIVTALPFRPLCQEDCEGLCAQCGARLIEHPDHNHEVTDPRWSDLHALLAEQGTKES
jgi:uncharacterized protein